MLSYQSCFPVYIGYPRITGTSKYRFLAFHSLFPGLGGRGFCFYWVIYCILQGWVPSVTCNQDPWWEKMANNLVREPSKGLTGGGGPNPSLVSPFPSRSPRYCPPPPPPQLRSLVPGCTPVAGPSLNLVATNHSVRKSRNKLIKAKVSLLSWRD